MKKLALLLVATFMISCNITNQEYELPSGYTFYRGGGSTNCIIRNQKMIIQGGAIDYSYNDNYIFFSVDTTKSEDKQIISKDLLIYFIHDIKKDTLYKSFSYEAFNRFVEKNKIEEKFDISKQRH